MKVFQVNIILVTLLFSCGNNENKPPNENSNLLRSSYFLLNRWLTYYDLEMKYFIDSLPMVERKVFEYEYDIKTDSKNNLKEFFIYSPDSANCIDLDSYSLIVENDSKGYLVCTGNEVDSEVAMVDINGKRKIRIVFCGTDCWAEEAQWVRNDFFYILGFSKIENQYFPTIWTFEKNNHFFQKIKTKKPIASIKMNYTRDIRLKRIKFKYNAP